MKDASDEDIAEESESERKRLLYHIILRGLKETESDEKDEAKEMDEAYVISLIVSLKISTTCKSIFRIGSDSTKKRPYKFIMKCKEINIIILIIWIVHSLSLFSLGRNDTDCVTFKTSPLLAFFGSLRCSEYTCTTYNKKHWLRRKNVKVYPKFKKKGAVMFRLQLN